MNGAVPMVWDNPVITYREYTLRYPSVWLFFHFTSPTLDAFRP